MLRATQLNLVFFICIGIIDSRADTVGDGMPRRKGWRQGPHVVRRGRRPSWRTGSHVIRGGGAWGNGNRGALEARAAAGWEFNPKRRMFGRIRRARRAWEKGKRKKHEIPEPKEQEPKSAGTWPPQPLETRRSPKP